MTMLLSALQDKTPAWAAAATPDCGVAVWSMCTLVRNLGDFPFPDVCSGEDKLSIRERIVAVLDKNNILSTGHYYNLEDLSELEIRYLSERQWVTHELAQAEGARGVFVSEDQTFSIMINGSDHLCLRSMHPGLQLQEAWAQLNLLDDTLGAALDFSFLESHGYLTPSMELIGTGLKANILLHLPALSFSGAMQAYAEQAEERRLLLLGVVAGLGNEDPAQEALQQIGLDAVPHEKQGISSTIGNLFGGSYEKTYGETYQVLNQCTLGLSEEEILFQVSDLAKTMVANELEARKELESGPAPTIRDRVGRAQGIAQNAHIMGFFEGLEVLSALRWGVHSGYLDKIALHEVNKAWVETQAAHLEMAAGATDDGLTLNTHRAAYMRGHFARN